MGCHGQDSLARLCQTLESGEQISVGTVNLTHAVHRLRARKQAE